MISQNSVNVHPNTWQQSLAEAIRDPKQLLDILGLNQISLASPDILNKFPLLVPKSFIARMKTGDINDPLLRQVLPFIEENKQQPGFVKDPLKETDQNPFPGMLHKYQGRVLLTLTAGCAVNCRYCFRRHFPYAENNPGANGWQRIVTELENSPDISEVILSGGDPLLISDKGLAKLCNQLAEIPHIKRIRFHTRIPIVLPNRINEQFIKWISQINKPVVMVLHCNHPNELNGEVKQALLPLQNNNITLLNQAVLLKNINDNADTLIELSEKLFDYGVLPYYLHLMDKVENAAHFDIEISNAVLLMQTVSSKLPGYLVPKLAQERVGHPAKTLIPYT